MSIKEAFFTACSKAEPAKGSYVSLYMNVPFYGGPEDGGWWGRYSHLMAYEHCCTAAEAEAKRVAVGVLAEQLSTQAKREFGEQCLRETEWLAQRGLDDSFLPEVDGETNYSVLTEESPGSFESRGCRHYE